MGPRVAAVVLVIEDDPEILRLMKQVLAQDYQVHTAASAEDALPLLREHSFHAVVSDQMLPAMSGVELLREVAHLQPNAARVLVTASTEVATAQDAINVARVRRFLAKPFRAQELLGVVGESVHEVAVAQIKSELVRELKERNQELASALSSLEARDKTLSRRLEGFAFRDPVTGLYIHRYFQEALRAELTRARSARKDLSLVLLDIEGFGAWNRNYGFAEGDALLQRVARLLGKGEAAARFGGGRFAVLLPATSGEEARAWADGVRKAARKLAGSKELAGPFTLRIGVARVPEDAQDGWELLEAARKALA